MSSGPPLPFRLALPDDDSIGWAGIRSVSYELDGLLHLDDDAVVLEWVARRKTEVVGFTGINKEIDESPIARADVPYELITRARLGGWWWAPRLDLYSRDLTTFDGIPSARGSTLALKIRFPDRALAAAVVRSIESARTMYLPGRDTPPALRGGE